MQGSLAVSHASLLRVAEARAFYAAIVACAGACVNAVADAHAIRSASRANGAQEIRDLVPESGRVAG